MTPGSVRNGGNGETGSGEKPPRGSRPSRASGENPRALGTNPRARGRGAGEKSSPGARPPVLKLWLSCPNCHARRLEWIYLGEEPSYLTCEECGRTIPYPAWPCEGWSSLEGEFTKGRP